MCDLSSVQNSIGNSVRNIFSPMSAEALLLIRLPYIAVPAIVSRVPPPNSCAVPPARSSPESVTMLITPQYAFSPYSDDPGPRTISIRLIICTGKRSNAGLSGKPPVSPELNGAPSMSSSTRLLNGFSPKPRMSTVATIGVQRTLTPATRRRTSGTVCEPDSLICFAVMTVTDAGALEIGISVFVAASTFGCSSPKSVTSPIDFPVCGCCC